MTALSHPKDPLSSSDEHRAAADDSRPVHGNEGAPEMAASIDHRLSASELAATLDFRSNRRKVMRQLMEAEMSTVPDGSEA